ncbi:hypothetical protein [Tenacibaculum agarivorans]|uniref:hypothetical protein n=1 Tax=Tenacibaculum agarivorans TaxID=1908389 RepID=UPI00094BB021|nr:hypothetical protein [Tenacibaculum agarivorans]
MEVGSWKLEVGSWNNIKIKKSKVIIALDFFIFTNMKEKLSHYWEQFGFWIYFIVYKVIEYFYGDTISFYYEKIPKPVITSALLLLLIYFIYKAFTPTKEKPEVLFIPSEDDYDSKDGSLGISVFLIIGFIIYASIFDTFNINYIILFLIVLVNTMGGIFLKKTASFQIKEGQITFKNGKEERIFKASEITSMEIYPNQIHLHKEDSKEVLLFLSLDKIDFQNIKTYFNKRVPEISATLASPVVN